jgi:hypothetical protein
MQIQETKFTLAETAKGSGASADSIQNWIKSGKISGTDQIEGGEGKGNRRLFSFRSVMEIAAANALLETTFQRDVAHAFRCAKIFAHIGEDGRIPGFPFEDGNTVLCASKDHARVIQYIPTHDILATMRDRLLEPTAFIVLDMSTVFDCVVQALGYQPQQQIDLAYKKAD